MPESNRPVTDASDGRSRAFRACVERERSIRIAFLGIAAISGPLIAAVLLWEGVDTAFALAAGLLAQVLVGATPFARDRGWATWWVTLAYDALGWVFVAVLTWRLRSSPACDRFISTAMYARLIVSAVVVLAAVVLAFALAAVSRLPHLPVVLLVVLAFVFAVATVPSWPQHRIAHVWNAIGNPYVPTHAYSAVCGESRPVPETDNGGTDNGRPKPQALFNLRTVAERVRRLPSR
jgi:hypothetical protein